MFPLLPAGSANTALKRLLDAINKAADAEQIPLRAEITAGKKGGAANRWVWFEGPVPRPALPYTGELNAIPQGQLITDQLGLPQEDRPIIVLITFNEHETVAVTRQFHPDGTPKAETRNSMTYNLLGVHGGIRIVHRVSKQGEGEAQNSAHDAIRDWNPHAVIGVGIAFGVNPAKQQIGDVLVSESWACEIMRP